MDQASSGMSSPMAEEYIQWLGIDRQLLSKKDSAAAEINRACHRKYTELHPAGGSSTKSEKEETTQQVRAACKFLITMFSSKETLSPKTNTNQIAAVAWPPYYDRPINEGQSEHGVHLRPVYAWWLRGQASNASYNPRAVEATDPRRMHRFEHRSAYYHTGGPFNPPEKTASGESESRKRSAEEDDQELDQPRDIKRPRHERRFRREAPRGRRRER